MVSNLIQTVSIPPRSLKSALQAVVKSDKTKKFGYFIQNIQENLFRLHSRRITVHMYWTVGHINLPGNELADRLAKEAATHQNQEKVTIHIYQYQK